MARRGSGSLSAVILVIVATSLVLGMSIKVRHRWDLSERRENVLAPQTLHVLAGLESEVRLHPLFTVDNPGRENYWYLLQQYRDASPKISVEFIDPVSRPGEVANLGLNPEQKSARRDGVTGVAQGDNRRIFDGVDEESVTNAIMDVSTTAPRVVGFIRGYGERDPISDGDSGYSLLAVELLQEYYQLTDVILSDGIPSTITVLVLAGPELPIPDEDLDVLAAWLEDGGRLLAMSDPDGDRSINRVLSRWSLRILGEPVIEPQRNLGRDPKFVKASNYSDHDIVQGFGSNFPGAFPVVGRVEHFESGDPLVFHEGLVQSTLVSAAVVDGTVIDGPFDLAAVSWRRDADHNADKETRIVAVGDSNFADNQYLHFRANRNFVLNCLGWLSRETNLVSVRRASLADQELDVGPEDRGKLLLVAYTVPFLICVAGIVVWFRRRGL
jgi:hypothetical protein